ncbi:MAG: FkbM family methyltransferase [Chitinivibrionia bacterium]|nr:FkbM family methyltransferase [Chitinivibrionia bacterium]
MEKGKDLSVYEINDYDFFFDKQYFSLPEMTCNDNEIFIDCGVFNGITVKDFVEFCKGKYNKIYAFEPIPDQYKNSLQNLQKWGIERVELIEKGVWSSEATFNFAVNGVSSQISDNGTIPIEVVAIDSVIPENENITFIKMDIEGAELEALKGAENTIRRCKPKLAICIYHKPMDVIEIPAFIISLVPEYKFYIRHHSLGKNETVLYAIL